MTEARIILMPWQLPICFYVLRILVVTIYLIYTIKFRVLQCRSQFTKNEVFYLGFLHFCVQCRKVKFCMFKFKTEAVKHVASQGYRQTSRKFNATKHWISELAQKAINITCDLQVH